MVEHKNKWHRQTWFTVTGLQIKMVQFCQGYFRVDLNLAMLALTRNATSIYLLCFSLHGKHKENPCKENTTQVKNILIMQYMSKRKQKIHPIENFIQHHLKFNSHNACNYLFQVECTNEKTFYNWRHTAKKNRLLERRTMRCILLPCEEVDKHEKIPLRATMGWNQQSQLIKQLIYGLTHTLY